MRSVNNPVPGAIYIGMISGTSRDGMDAVLISMEADAEGQERPRLLKATCAPYPGALRLAVDQLIDLRRSPSALESRQADHELGHFCADVCRSLLKDAGLKPGDLRAIGSHGQTIWHEPAAEPPLSIQIGSAEVLEAELGVPVVADFRAADLRAGGEGAPLAPLLHQALFTELAPCAIINLGGIANVTLLGEDGTVRGFDTGPANCLLDAWTERHRGMPYDPDGAFARAGSVLPELLERLLQEPYFDLPPPKSTGLELFNLPWLDARLSGQETPEDVQRTLLELTVETVARAVERTSESPRRALLCGGGTHNGFMVQRFEARLKQLTVSSTAAAGVDPDWIEATLFALLAHRRLLKQWSDTSAITGASKPVLLGEIIGQRPSREIAADSP